MFNRSSRKRPLLLVLAIGLTLFVVSNDVFGSDERKTAQFHYPKLGVTIPAPHFKIVPALDHPVFGFGVSRGKDLVVAVTAGITPRREISEARTFAEIALKGNMRIRNVSSGRIGEWQYVKFLADLVSKRQVTATIEVRGPEHNVVIACNCDQDRYPELAKEFESTLSSVQIGKAVQVRHSELPTFHDERFQYAFTCPNLEASAGKKEFLSVYFSSSSADDSYALYHLKPEAFPSEKEIADNIESFKKNGFVVSVLRNVPGDLIFQVDKPEAGMTHRKLRLGEYILLATGMRQIVDRQGELKAAIAESIMQITSFTETKNSLRQSSSENSNDAQGLTSVRDR